MVRALPRTSWITEIQKPTTIPKWSHWPHHRRDRRKKKRKAIHEYCTCLISVRNLSVFQKSLFSNCPCHLTSWEKGDQKATWICKKVSFVGTTEIELTAPSQTKLPSPIPRDFTMRKKQKQNRKTNLLGLRFLAQIYFYLKIIANQSINLFFHSLSVPLFLWELLSSLIPEHS